MGPGPAVTLVSSGLNQPLGVAVDGAGNVYVADYGDQAIKEWNAATQQVTTLVSSGLSNPWGVAVDGSGNVYIADTNNAAIKQWSPSTQQVTTVVGTSPTFPTGIAVDGSGNIYFADTAHDAVKEWNASTQQVTTVVGTDLSFPVGVAVDGSGNLYIADSNDDAIKQWNESTQQVTTVLGSGLSGPYGVAVDGSGNLYIADTDGHSFIQWSASAQSVTTLLSSGLYAGVAVDGAGNVYLTDSYSHLILEIPYAFVGPPSLTEPVAGGSDALLPVLPSTAPLTSIFAPSSDQSWLTIGTVANGVVSFSFTENTSVARTAHITVLGQQIAVTQNGLPAQTINFGTLSNQFFGVAPFPVGATASSGLTVSFNSQTPGVCTVSGSTVTLAAIGICTIQATQAGNTNWAAAPPVGQSFQVLTGIGVPHDVCDLQKNQNINVADVQLIVNQALGVGAAVNDLNIDGAVNSIDVQVEINAVLGLGCSAN
jgi:sugar lactone lactonase YvrE